MRRREFVRFIAGAATGMWPARNRAQESQTVVGFLSSARGDRDSVVLSGFKQGLAEAGFVTGRNLSILERWTGDRLELLPNVISEFSHARLTALLVSGTMGALAATRRAGLNIPIIYVIGIDPVTIGVDEYRSRVDTEDVTHFTNVALARATCEFLSELLPRASHFGLLLNSENADAYMWADQIRRFASNRRYKLSLHESFDGRQLDEIFMSFRQTGTQGLIIASDTSFFRLRARIVRLAARHRIPAIYSQREFAEAGGLITYGLNVTHACRLAGVYMGNILKGEPLRRNSHAQPPAELVLNVATAKTLGLRVPESLLRRATALAR